MKIPFKNKGYHLITNVKSVKFLSKQTMNYKNYIDNMLPYEHENPEEWTVWKVITDVAYRSRINVRAISYPGWGKDSPLVVLSLLRMDVASADKPSYPKLKWMLSNKNKIIGLNEVQAIMAEEKRHLAKFYESTGAFEPAVVFDKRATNGVEEVAELENVSSMTFYNIPENPDEALFDDCFHPKVAGRVFPLMLTGGSHKVTALKEGFTDNITSISDDEVLAINEIVNNQKYYEDEWQEVLKGREEWKIKHSFNNNRWQRNYVTICNGLKMYSYSEEEFSKWEEVLWNMHKNYQDFLFKWRNNGESVLLNVEEELVMGGLNDGV
jgi:hypothetical protein